MKILVTGAAGFIGGYVCDELLKRGCHVIGLDNFSKYGKNPAGYRFTMIEGDARNTDLVAALLKGCDHFIAGAALIGGIEYFHRKPFDIIRENNDITGAAADAALRYGGLEKVTWISSSMVYESTDHWPSAEGDQLACPPPLSSYGFQKLSVEYYARAAWDQYRLPYTIVRPFNCVGIGEDAKMSHVVPDLIRKIADGQDPLHILGDGSQVRHYTYGGDLARGIVTAMMHPAAMNEDFNLSSPVSTTVLELAELIWEKMKPGVPFRYVSDTPFTYDVQRRIPSAEKARNLLGWEAATTLSSMVDVVISEITSAVVSG